MAESITIDKGLIVGYLLTKCTEEDGQIKVNTIPLVGEMGAVLESRLESGLIDYSNVISEISMGPKHSIIGFLPSNSLSYVVNGGAEALGFSAPLGFEFEGASHPDWKKVFWSKYLESQEQIKEDGVE